MQLKPGTTLGTYEIVGALGSGGMGDVYRALDPKLQREVAIKVLPEKLAEDAEALARFEREARALAQLSHPNILSIHDFGQEDKIIYAVMELLEGESLRETINRQPLSWRRAVEIGAAIADGLAAAHAKNLVHRDLKPENIFLTKDGRVKILDFGLVREEWGDEPDDDSDTFVPGKTAPGVVMGTVGYMSPEQVRGKGVGQSTDIFALGCILHEMLTGKKTFGRESAAETLAAILKEDAPHLGDSGISVPLELDRVVRHCLEKKASSRFHSASDLAFDLRTILTNPNLSGSFFAMGGRGGSRVGLWAVAFALGLAAAFWWLNMRQPPPAVEAAPNLAASVPLDKSIAVLPFKNIGEDQETEYFTEGMTEEITAQLSQIRDLRVISRTSTTRYKNSDKPLKEIASELGVSTILEGSVRRFGDKVRITGQLIDTQTDAHLWAETYERDLEDVFSIQTDVAMQIATALQATLSPEEKRRIGERGTLNLEAYNHYLRGRHFWNQRSEDGFEKAIDAFEAAIEEDENYAQAWSGLADAYSLSAVYGYKDQEEATAIAEESARRALEIDPDLAHAYASLGLILATQKKGDEAVANYQKAIELNPNYASSHHWYATWLSGSGDVEGALEHITMAQKLDPMSPIITLAKGLMLEELGRSEEAMKEIQHTLEIDPTFTRGRFVMAQMLMVQEDIEGAEKQLRVIIRENPDDHEAKLTLGTALFFKDDGEGAFEIFNDVMEEIGEDNSRIAMSAKTGMAIAYTQLDQDEKARQLLAEIKAAEGVEPTMRDFSAAIVLLYLDEEDKGFAELRKVAAEMPKAILELKKDPAMKRFQEDPRFTGLLEKARKDWEKMVEENYRDKKKDKDKDDG